MATGQWWYNSDSGSVDQQTVPDWLGGSLPAHLGVGWHGPFATKQDAYDYYTRNAPNNPGWKPPTDSKVNAVAQEATGSSAATVVGNIQAYFMRIGEILLGLVLIAVGVMSITGTGGVVKSALKVAAL